MPLIEIKKLNKSYQKTAVLRDLSFHIDEGDYFYVVGENGSGKTTLMKLILGLLQPDSGEIKFCGFGKNEIGYLPQTTEIRSDFPASVREVVLSGTLCRERFFPFYTRRDRRTADKMMERLDIADLKTKPFSQLSGGQRQRVLLARALCATRKVLLLDEPITGLDPLATAEFYEIIEELRREGITVIMISHDVSCAVHYGNKILHLGNEGYFFGTSEEYVHSPLGQQMLAGGHCHD